MTSLFQTVSEWIESVTFDVDLSNTNQRPNKSLFWKLSPILPDCPPLDLVSSVLALIINYVVPNVLN